MAAAAALATPALYPAFFFVLEKGSKSAGNAVIPTFPMHRSHGLKHLRHKHRNVRFKGLRWVHTPPQPLTAHTAAYTPKQGAFRMGRYHYPRHELHVHEHLRAGYQNGKPCRFWGLVGGTLKERREPAEQRCAHARRCSEASRPRWAAWSFFVSDEITACTPYSRNFFQFSRRSSLCCSCASCLSARNWSRAFGFVIVIDHLF